MSYPQEVGCWRSVARLLKYLLESLGADLGASIEMIHIPRVALEGVAQRRDR